MYKTKSIFRNYLKIDSRYKIKRDYTNGIWPVYLNMIWLHLNNYLTETNAYKAPFFGQ